ncbi:hypothetical protein Hanom_Chr01g00065211 [Helianthus anomalus]
MVWNFCVLNSPSADKFVKSSRLVKSASIYFVLPNLSIVLFGVGLESRKSEYLVPTPWLRP